LKFFSEEKKETGTGFQISRRKS